DSVGIANAFARAAEQMGAQIILGNEVSKLNITNGTIESVLLSDATRISCSKAVLCTNVWTNKLLANSGASDLRHSFPLWTVAHPIVAFKRPTQFQGKKPIIWDYPGKTYYK